jgi:hypothetical protein
MPDYILHSIQGAKKQTEQIRNRSQLRETAQNTKFFVDVDCLGTYNVEGM